MAGFVSMKMEPAFFVERGKRFFWGCRSVAGGSEGESGNYTLYAEEGVFIEVWCLYIMVLAGEQKWGTEIFVWDIMNGGFGERWREGI